MALFNECLLRVQQCRSPADPDCHHKDHHDNTNR